MEAESLNIILSRCAESRQQNELFRSLLPEDASHSLRVNFARCAIDLALEHHSALIRVVEAGEYGAAAALLRPILEASTIGFWFVYVASWEEIQSLQLDGCDNPIDDVPMLRDMAAQLTSTFPAIQSIVDEFKKGGAAKWLHKYAHGGTPQLNRRIGHGWTERDVMLMLVRADLFSVLAGCLETVLTPNPPLSSYGFARRDQLAGELSREFGGPQLPQQPHELPAAPLWSADCEDRPSES
ncbi:hypothetical protein KWH04_23310 [Xanthomonas campestris pv. trichodesmae]|uniref:HEPN AbiU2-like domain-containing protein n=2 Tax=Xanthomonas citri TaxID=346 RepID=A0AB33CH18_XANCI|nr:hypothetical protein [Xanthomonas citri]ASK93087.1 hypothetical protein XcvCFBP7111P_17660 [Xanthomonas citri pv. vignicola]MBV6783484.1 hypothetical protein [Xanthomonas campestris pv. trichodesmae]MBZ3918616.1 hypothetical protein [Xanthomonas campestris pv. trichodesmae]MBZ3926742.1 hypothetical protein [Xanthomonas citri pv. sesbaniae]